MKATLKGLTRNPTFMDVIKVTEQGSLGEFKRYSTVEVIYNGTVHFLSRESVAFHLTCENCFDVCQDQVKYMA